ncbi:MAG: adenylyl-sulfate kinase [Aquabacterium sp.]|jgi:adenylyl-sulfate kinase|uniref:adenylyl-sulfate kinase n=1 Tax=Aquabacterium sp. TaxID=1872578 RepID=UPI002A371702|nr:adenylyl-sulfate kinase [Aquabacterium sp.]MDX9843179.1 adenylyl-sulfate kinase [Aquabacterium sp.]
MRTAPHVFWLTGLPASGKTTLANALVAHLTSLGVRGICLDGDQLRQGLCSDLGFDADSRKENIRRAGEVSRLLHGSGLTVIGSFVSPFVADRAQVRGLFQPGDFSEVHLCTSLQECMRRDPKGLYAQAQRGDLIGLTGWDAPYEPPQAPEFSFDTQVMAPEEMAQILYSRIFEEAA